MNSKKKLSYQKSNVPAGIEAASPTYRVGALAN